MSTHINRAIVAVVLAAAGMALTSCTSMTRGSESSSYLIIDRLTASAGGTGKAETTLQSDVTSFFEDVGTVALRLALKDPGVPTTTNNFITVNRYRVVYTRADGRNTPGVDVPFAFDGAFTVTVRAEGTAEGSFPIVRRQAKEEPPLRNLIGNSGQGVISVIADVTFFGHDQTGRAVSVTGKISIHFADWP